MSLLYILSFFRRNLTLAKNNIHCLSSLQLGHASRWQEMSLSSRVCCLRFLPLTATKIRFKNDQQADFNLVSMSSLPYASCRYSPLAIKWNSIFKVWLRKSFNFFPFYRISIFGAQTQNVSRRLSIFGSVSFLLHSIDSPNSSNLKIQIMKM